MQDVMNYLHKKNKEPFSNLKVPFQTFSWALHIFRVAIWNRGKKSKNSKHFKYTFPIDDKMKAKSLSIFTNFAFGTIFVAFTIPLIITISVCTVFSMQLHMLNAHNYIFMAIGCCFAVDRIPSFSYDLWLCYSLLKQQTIPHMDHSKWLHYFSIFVFSQKTVFLAFQHTEMWIHCMPTYNCIPI